MSVSVCLCMCVCVCLSVPVRDHIFETTRPIFTKFFSARYLWSWLGSILFWWRSDTLCTSGFMEDVMFAHKPKLLDVAAQLKRSAHTALGLAINCAGQQTRRTTFRAPKVTSQVATPGAESTVFDCLVKPRLHFARTELYDPVTQVSVTQSSVT